MRRVNFAGICILAGWAVAGWAQLAPPAREIPLYAGVAPGSENWNYPEKAAGTPERPQAQNIVRPVLLYYPADKAQRSRDGDDCRAGRRFPDADDVL